MKPCPNNFPVPVIHLEETDSTSHYLNQLCSEQQHLISEFTTVTAQFQTAGKGQRGNGWESERGKNLLFSFIFYPSFLEAKKQFILSQLISLAIKEELDQWTDCISIKWPNDIYWKEQKICGILIENELTGHQIDQSIAGIGININQDTFHSDAPNPVSLKQITGKEYDCNLILAGIMKRIKDYYARLQDKDGTTKLIMERYANSLFRKEGFHLYRDKIGEFSARLSRVESDGRFILEDKTGKEREYLFKEVQYML
ncbi:MAG: biotin--[acetyl-CoA-carboxylase] ligase [Bacteroides sp.]|jgi:BirA family biotin operon repressor/biotin-[acetyl-CoA-carboxylase] ligase|nr:biotin--[acetyl-CoA-carboxylase] ligase [Bacteroides sp.]